MFLELIFFTWCFALTVTLGAVALGRYYLRKNDPRRWAAHDEVLLTALLWREAIGRGEPPAVGSPVSSHVTMNLGEGERELAAGTYQGRSWGIEGDGSYMHRYTGLSDSLLATGTIWLINTALNQRAQEAAAAAATPHWVKDAEGGLVLTSLGIYFEQRGVWAGCPWETLSDVRVTGAGGIEITITADGSTYTALIVSGYAELIFLAWAGAVCPDHPQLTSDSWLPPGWLDRARDHGRLPTHHKLLEAAP